MKQEEATATSEQAMLEIRGEIRQLNKTLGTLAAAELPARYLSPADQKKRYHVQVTLNDPQATIRFCETHFQALIQGGLQEECHLLTLDSAMQLIRIHNLTVGLLNRSELHPREVFRPAILDAAHSVILLHNHPSGKSTPSPQDRKITQQLKAAGVLLGIQLVDHIILSRSGSLSLFEHAS